MTVFREAWLVAAPLSVLLSGVAVAAATTPAYGYDGPATLECPLSPATSPDPVVQASPDVAAAPVACGYDDPVNLARTNARLDGDGFAPQTVVRAESAADAARLARQLQFEEAASVFTRSGGLHPSVIQGSRPILQGSQLRNPQAIKALTADGSNIADWAKYSTQSFQSPSRPFQVHFYRNQLTGATNYSIDYKVVFGGSP